jgi:hypothetical protein
MFINKLPLREFGSQFFYRNWEEFLLEFDRFAAF